MRKAVWASLLLVGFNYFLAIYFYPKLPSQIVSHWNSAGEANGYMSKEWGLFFVPALLTVMLVLFLIIPKIDPLRKNILQFQNYFDFFIISILAFLTYVFILTLEWNLGKRFDFIVSLLPAFALLFFYVGIMLQNSKQNWFIGIRTPWTLMSEQVWNKTHRLGGSLFKIASLVSLLGLIFKAYAFWLLIIPILAAAVIPMVYSYLEFQKQGK